MSVNKHQPHVLVLPEDDSNRQLANGFHLELDWDRSRRMQVLTPAGGWAQVVNRFVSDHVPQMKHNPHRFMVLLIDFDGRSDRLENAKARIPEDLTRRVFILGASTQPEALRQANMGSYEEIGMAMARDCRQDTDHIWAHNLLRHNAGELARLREHVREILFP